MSSFPARSRLRVTAASSIEQKKNHNKVGNEWTHKQIHLAWYFPLTFCILRKLTIIQHLFTSLLLNFPCFFSFFLFLTKNSLVICMCKGTKKSSVNWLFIRNIYSFYLHWFQFISQAYGSTSENNRLKLFQKVYLKASFIRNF